MGPRSRSVSLEGARPGRLYTIVALAQSGDLERSSISALSSRLEELGFFPGKTLAKLSDLGAGGTVIVRIVGSRVALSHEVARSILVKPAAQSANMLKYLGHEQT